MNEKLTPVDACTATVTRGGKIEEKAGAQGHYDVVCHGPDGQVRWVESAKNVVMNQGKNYILDNALAGSSFTTLGPKMSLVTNSPFTGYNATDTYASHTGWAESTAYSVRQAVTWAAASGGTKGANSVTFSITGNDTIRGCAMFFTTTTTIADATNDASHLLLSGADFSAPRTIQPGDTITVTYSLAI